MIKARFSMTSEIRYDMQGKKTNAFKEKFNENRIFENVQSYKVTKLL